MFKWKIREDLWENFFSLIFFCYQKCFVAFFLNQHSQSLHHCCTKYIIFTVFVFNFQNERKFDYYVNENVTLLHYKTLAGYHRQWIRKRTNDRDVSISVTVWWWRHLHCHLDRIKYCFVDVLIWKHKIQFFNQIYFFSFKAVDNTSSNEQRSFGVDFGSGVRNIRKYYRKSTAICVSF